MNVLDRTSLATTVDAVHHAYFLGHVLPDRQRQAGASWIAGRAAQHGSYEGMPAPTERDFATGCRVFTGERTSSGAGTAHVLGEEACRALLLLDVGGSKVQKALETATESMGRRLRKSRRRETNAGREWGGTYCCAKCTCALWRHLTAGGLSEVDPEEWLVAGVKSLARHRREDGRWRRFPFWYTLLALTDMDFPAAANEMRHGAARCEKLLQRRPREQDVHDRRRRELARRVLAQC